jgi:hypothetical protein
MVNSLVAQIDESFPGAPLVVSSARRISVVRTVFHTSTALDSTASALTLFMISS